MGLQFARVATSIGPMLIAETERGVASVTTGGDLPLFVAGLRRRFPERDPEPGSIDAGWVDRVLDGGAIPPIDTRGLSAFDVRVYHAVREVRQGTTVTYGEVAALIGSPGAARAVGGALARCPLFPAVPCHRVVRASDGWSGWGGDDRLKRTLLARESSMWAAK
ncbi:MAG: methylated-DNA--[protein]-cysteine S-methyltransferase [Candidatus Limnocylindria bacterium]